MKRLFKRLGSFVLSVVLISTMLFSATTYINAAESENAQPAVFTVTSVKGISQKTVDVEVRVSENSYICAADWELKFDSSKLLFKNFEGGDILSVGMYSYNANISDCVKVSFSSIEPIQDGGALFTVEFLVTDDTYNQYLDVKLDVNSLITNESNTPDYSVKDGHVEVVDLLYGDINLDNRITAVDVLKVLNHLTDENPLTEEELKIADVNGDAEVTTVDALQILYFTAEMGDMLYTTKDEQMDFFIYNLESPKNVQVTDLQEYEFTVSWDKMDYVTGYNVYLDGKKINQYLLKDTSITIGGANGDKSVAAYLHNSIDHNTEYTIEVTAENALKESEKSEVLNLKTKRAYSYITFKNWDGTIIGKTQKVLYGQDAVVPNDPTKKGYDFVGWDKPTTEIIDDAVITALFEIHNYYYKFFDYDGKEISSQLVAYQGTATPPNDPTREGHTFSGWYTEQNGGEKVTDFSNAEEDKNYYAHYIINKYTFTFNSQGGSAVSSYTGDYDTLVQQPTNPSRYSYVFSGWYKDAACKQKWNFATDKIKTDTTLYAKWTPIVITINKSKLNFTSTGASETLQVSFSSGSDTIKWYSDNNNVATVDTNTGKVTAKGHGTCNIYIQGANSARRAVCVVTVVAQKTAWVYNTGSSLTIRAQGTTASAAVGRLTDGTQITVYGDIQNRGVSGQTGWYNISSSAGNGWVSANYVTFSKPSSPASTPVQGFGTQENYNGSVYYTITGYRNHIISQRQYDGDKFGYYVGDHQRNEGCTATSAMMVISMVTGKRDNPTLPTYWTNGVGATWYGMKQLGANLSSVYNELVNKKRPCVVYFYYGGMQHAVVAVGIRKGANVNALKTSDVLIVDPWLNYYSTVPVPSAQIKLLSSYNISRYIAVYAYNG